MAEITTTQAFSDGDTVTAAKLNNIIANASVGAEIITNRSELLTVDGANDFVLGYDASATGLRKIKPSNLVAGSPFGAGTAGAPSITTTGDTNTGIFFPAADTAAISTAGTERVRVDSSGLVGIGTTAPSTDGYTSYKNLVISGSGNSGLTIKSGTTSAGGIAFNDAAGGIRGFATYDHSDDSLQLGSAGSESLRIDSSGNVGVGTTSLSKKLTVYSDNSTAYSSSDFDSARNILVQNANTTTNANVGVQFLVGDNSEAAITAIRTGDGAADLAFGVRGGGSRSERLRITSGGLVGIGTTSPSVDLHILQSVATSAGGVRIQENASASKYYRTLYTDSSGIFRFNNGTNEATITLAGAFVNASDIRLKKDIIEIKYGLKEVMETRPKSFKRVDVDGEYFGFIAQELQNVLPEAISGDPESQLGVDYGSLVAVAFRAIQELKAENDSLKTRIAALEAA